VIRFNHGAHTPVATNSSIQTNTSRGTAGIVGMAAVGAIVVTYSALKTGKMEQDCGVSVIGIRRQTNFAPTSNVPSERSRELIIRIVLVRCSGPVPMRML